MIPNILNPGIPIKSTHLYILCESIETACMINWSLVDILCQMPKKKMFTELQAVTNVVNARSSEPLMSQKT